MFMLVKQAVSDAEAFKVLSATLIILVVVFIILLIVNIVMGIRQRRISDRLDRERWDAKREIRKREEEGRRRR